MVSKNPRKAARDRGKTWERQVAKDLGTTRTGPTGKDDSDVIHPNLGVECKAYAKLKLLESDLQQAKNNAKGRLWVLAMKEKQTGRRVAIIDWDHFVALIKDQEALLDINDGEKYGF